MPETVTHRYQAPYGRPARPRDLLYRGGRRVEGYQTLQIARPSRGGGAWLIRRDQDGADVSRTWHADAEAAFDAAEVELGIRRDEWEPNYGGR